MNVSKPDLGYIEPRIPSKRIKILILIAHSPKPSGTE